MINKILTYAKQLIASTRDIFRKFNKHLFGQCMHMCLSNEIKNGFIYFLQLPEIKSVFIVEKDD